MSRFAARLDETEGPLPQPVLCDAWLADGRRFGDELSGSQVNALLGRWPAELETDAVVQLAGTVGEAATWADYADTPPVAQKLAERARLQPLDLEIARHLQHLQHVCHTPRLHLRVEEERLPVSRARRTPVRAVAELVSHPGDWERRTLRSIQPMRVLARQIEDEWNLYENRVAARLVDHLLRYLGDRLEVLREIERVVEGAREHDDELRRTTHWRAKRIAELWAKTLESSTAAELARTIKRLELAQRDLQKLLDSPLYLRLPRGDAVPTALKPTNILVNDPGYRKVAALWRAWARFGQKHHETTARRAERRQREAVAWDRFVLHLVVRAFEALGWSAATQGNGWDLTKTGWLDVRMRVEPHGILRISCERELLLLPLCADLGSADAAATLAQLEAFDGAPHHVRSTERHARASLPERGEPRASLSRERLDVVLVHVRPPAALADADRASGWSFGRQAVLFACSPWGIDSEERMARLLQGWLSRAAVPAYPIAVAIRALPAWRGQRDWWRRWLRYQDGHLVAFRAPYDHERDDARRWSKREADEFDEAKRKAKAAKQAFADAPRAAIDAFDTFLEDAGQRLAGLAACPVCASKRGDVEVRPGNRPDGSDASWWATCSNCGSEWGTRSCSECGYRYRALTVGKPGLDVEAAAHSTPAHDWPDRVLGRDVWAQPCAERPKDFRCPKCGRCPSAACARCPSRSGERCAPNDR